MGRKKNPQTMEILAIPYGEIDGNSCQYMLYREMEQLDCDVDDYRRVNPFENKYDIVHVHWPELFANGKTIFHVLKKSNRFLRALAYQKKQGAKLVWTCHDVVSHNRPYPLAEKLVMHLFIRLVDGIIAPLQASYGFATSCFPQLKNTPYTIIPTGHYLDIYNNNIPRREVREILNISPEKTVIGFVGNISPYKGVFELLKTFHKITQQNTVLLLAGKPDSKKTRETVRKLAGDNENIAINWGMIPNDRMQMYFNASDLIVLPFREINNSGSLYMALGFGRHVLVPDVPQMREVKELYAPYHVHLFEKGNLKAEDIITALSESNTQAENKPDLSVMNYDKLARSTKEFFSSIITG